MPTVTKQKPAAVLNGMRTSGAKGKYQSAWDLGAGIKILLYGSSGTGKTTLWATFPKPILCLVCSGGSRPGELRSIDTPEYRKSIDARIIRSTEEIKEMLADSASFATVVLDHVSGLQDLTLKEILGIDELPAQKSWGMATMQQYGQSTMQCKEILRAMLNLSSNVVVIGQERRDNEDKEESDIQIPTVGVATSPSLAGWLNPAVDYICQTFKKPRMVIQKNTIGGKIIETTARGRGVDYCLRTAPHDVFTTKFRVPKGQTLPELIVDPTFDKIHKLIKGG